jgi:hypothetical protein
MKKKNEASMYIMSISRGGIIETSKLIDGPLPTAIETFNLLMDEESFDPHIDDARIFTLEGIEAYSYSFPEER